MNVDIMPSDRRPAGSWDSEGPQHDPSRIDGLSRGWASERAARTARLLALAACLLLFLESAGTVQIVYTIRASYGLFLAALAVGLPFAMRGFARLPRAVRWSALALVVAHVGSALIGEQAVLSASGRGGEHRELIYLADLVLGLGVIGLICGLWPPGKSLGPPVAALLAGAALATLYGLYQWPAQHFGWPFDDLNNTLDSNGVTQGAAQGNGLIAWERIRGTFLEPHFLGAYLASLLPLAAVAIRSRRPAIHAFGWLAGAAILLVLLLTASVPAWAALGAGTIVALTVLAIARAKVGLAGIMGCATVATVLVMAVAAASPDRLAPVTGRSATELAITRDFRTGTWERALEVWSDRPLLGHGPGQSSVQLAQAFGEPVLVSAQGLWAASLIDAGVLGFAAWLCLLGAVIGAAMRTTLLSPAALRVALLFGTTTSILASEVTGDRIGLLTWALVGVTLAAAGREDSRAGDVVASTTRA